MNRQQRRAQERQAAKSHKAGPRPTGERGVDVDYDDHYVYLTLMEGDATFTKKWQKQDAVIVGNMIVEAGEQGPKQDREVVRQSGIVVAKELPGG